MFTVPKLVDVAFLQADVEVRTADSLASPDHKDTTGDAPKPSKTWAVW
jgi:hypothetical protein